MKENIRSLYKQRADVLYRLLIEYLEQRVACAGERLRRTVCGDLIGVFAADEADTGIAIFGSTASVMPDSKRNRKPLARTGVSVHLSDR